LVAVGEAKGSAVLTSEEGNLTESGWSCKNLQSVNEPWLIETGWKWVKKPAFLNFKQIFSLNIYSGDWYIRVGGSHYGYFGKIFIDMVNFKTKEWGYDETWTSFYQSFPFQKDD